MKRKMWNKIVALGMAFGMLTASMPVLAFEDEMIVEDDSYIVVEDDTEAAMEPIKDGTEVDVFDDSLIVEEDGVEVEGETPPDGATDETEAELYAAEDADIPIDEAHFPDEKFREIISSVDFDRNRNGVLSPDEIADITRLDISQLSIYSLDGVEYFTCLEYLNIGSSLVTSLDLSKNTALQELYCGRSWLTSLDVSNNTALKELGCDELSLTSLDVSNNTALEVLSCTHNQLTSLDLSNNTALTGLRCDYNKLTSLDLSKNTALTWLMCNYNQLTNLDISKNTSLANLECTNNSLTSLDLSNKTALVFLYCDHNQLTSLDIRDCPILVKAYQEGEVSYYDYDNTVQYYITIETESGSASYSIICDPSLTFIADGIEDPDDPGDPIIVVSLGDSYSSGEGIEPFYGQDLPLSVKVDDRDWLSHRSQNSWPGMIWIPGVKGIMRDYKYDPNLTTESLKKQDCIWFFRAVSGAETKHFHLEKQKKTVRQEDRGLKTEIKNLPLQTSVFDEIRNRDLGTVDYVTLSVGGNDVKFSNIITMCATKSTYLGSLDLEEELNKLWANIENTKKDIKDVYYAIYDETGPSTKIIVAGYPKLLDPNGKGAAISWKEANLVNSSVTRFNQVIHDIVDSCRYDMDIYFVDIEQKFGTTHQAYSEDNWLNGIILGARKQDLDHLSVGSSYSLHPNYLGAMAYAEAVNAKIEMIMESGN